MGWLEPVYAVGLTMVIAVVVAVCVQWREGRVGEADQEERARMEERDRDRRRRAA